MSLAGAALVLVAIIMVVSLMNQERQATVNQRQAFLNQTQALNGINQALVTALAQAAVRDNDTDARTLLASEGITATANPATAPGAGAPK